MDREPRNRTVRRRAVNHIAILVVMVTPVLGCAINNERPRFAGVQFAAVDTRQQPKMPKDRQQPRPKQPPPSNKPEGQREHPRPKGSGDVMPVAQGKSGADSAVAAAIAMRTVRAGDRVDGLAGAIWADANNDGDVDGYMMNDQYYVGAPAGYSGTLQRVETGPLGGATLGTAAGAVIPGVSILQNAIVGAPVRGLAGAIWADRDRDGVVDGYVYNGHYYPGAPPMADPAPKYPAPPHPPPGQRG